MWLAARVKCGGVERLRKWMLLLFLAAKEAAQRRKQKPEKNTQKTKKLLNAPDVLKAFERREGKFKEF